MVETLTFQMQYDIKQSDLGRDNAPFLDSGPYTTVLMGR